MYFARDPNQQTRERDPHVVYTEPRVWDYALAVLTQWGVFLAPFLLLGLLWWLDRRARVSPAASPGGANSPAG